MRARNRRMGLLHSGAFGTQRVSWAIGLPLVGWLLIVTPRAAMATAYYFAMRNYPERRTNRQLEVLVIFLRHARRQGGRNTYPTMREIGRQMVPPVTHTKALLDHLDALFRRADIQPRL